MIFEMPGQPAGARVGDCALATRGAGHLKKNTNRKIQKKEEIQNTRGADHLKK